jgi:hypothetical protein
MDTLKIKTRSFLLASGLGLSTAALIAVITGCTSGPFSSNLNGSPPGSSTPWKSDNRTPPVYTSPTTTPATNDLSNSPS